MNSFQHMMENEDKNFKSHLATLITLVEEKFVKINEHNIRYLNEGKNEKTIVLIHGLGASAERWECVMPYFTKKYRVIAPDLIGFGLSDKPNADYTIDFFVKFLSDFLDSLEIKEATLVGSSLGGQIVAEYAISNPTKLEKMVLVSPSGVVDYSTPALDSYITAALHPNKDNVKNAFQIMSGNDKHVKQEIVELFLNRISLPNAKMAFMSALMSNRNAKISCEKLANVSIPSLVIWGLLDPVIPIENAKLFFSCISNCQYIEMEGCGHTPFVDMPQKFSEIILKFLNR